MRSAARALTFLVACGCGPAVGLDSEGGGETGESTSAAATTATTDVSGTTAVTTAADSGSVATTDGDASTVSTVTGSEDETTSSGGEPQPPALSRIFIFYTAHGVYAPDGLDPEILEPLAAYMPEMLTVEGIERIDVDPEGTPPMDAHSIAPPSLLTGGLLGPSVGNDDLFDPHFAAGPSIEVVIGQALGDGPWDSVHLGVRASRMFPSYPNSVSYLAAEEPNDPFLNVVDAIEPLFDVGVNDPEFAELLKLGQVAADNEPLASLDAQFALAEAAFAHGVTRSLLLSVDESVPRIRWQSLGEVDTFHELLVTSIDSADALPIVVTWAERLAAFRETLDATTGPDGLPLGDSTLLVWISEYDHPAAHSRRVFATVIDPTDTFAKGGRELGLEYNQADLAVTLAWGLGVELDVFGHPDLDAEVILPMLGL